MRRARSAGAMARHAGPAATRPGHRLVGLLHPVARYLGDDRLGGRVDDVGHVTHACSLLIGSLRRRSVRSAAGTGIVVCRRDSRDGCRHRTPAVARRTRAASTSPAKRRTSPYSSGCHWTPTAKRAAQDLDGLDDPVVAAGRHQQRVPQLLDGLVVAALDHGPVPQQAVDDGARLGHHGHLAEGPGRGLVAGRAEQVGELLDEGAAEEDVQDLVTPADGEQRKVALEGGVEQLELELVAELAHAAVAAVGLLAVALGRTRRHRR